MTLSVFVTAQRWTDEAVDAMSGQITGIVVGDLFCQKRMFENELYDVLSVAARARDRGLDVVFQAPMYNSSRSFETTLALINGLRREHLIQAVLLHDIGLLRCLSGSPDIKLWWDRFGFNRDMLVSGPLIAFLRDHGISAMELVRPAHIGDLEALGMPVVLFSYGPNIVTFGRSCYTEDYLHEACERKILCARARPTVASVDKVRLEYIADGFTLLDLQEPVYRLPNLTADQAGGVSAITAYIRGEDELSAVTGLRAALLAGRDEAARQPGS